MGAIGTFLFFRLEGPQIPALAAAVEIINREGVDGTAYRVDALKAEELTIVTREGISQLSTAQGRADDYAAIKGTLVTVVDDFARSVSDVLVVDVRVTRVQSYLFSTPTGVNYVVEAVWLLKPTAT